MKITTTPIDNQFNGLSDLEVQNQISKYGFNELPASNKKNFFDLFFEIMKEPMFILLVSSAIIYVFLGDYREGLILMSATSLIIFITFFQYRKAENALAALSKLSSPQALVFRNNQFKKVPGREVVPNDIVLLNEGDRAVADSILIESNHLWMDEAL
jgi:Ca2+-transporting ATPase